MPQLSTGFSPDRSIQAEIDHGLRAMRLMTLSFLCATLMFGIVGILMVRGAAKMGPTFRGLDPTVASQAMIALLLVSGTLALVSLVILPRYHQIERFAERQSTSSPNELVQEFAKIHAIRLAMVEIIALFGFVLTNLTGRMQYLYIFGGITIFFMLLLFPRKSSWDEVRNFLQKTYGT